MNPHRWPRPTMMWLGVLLVVLVLIFFVRLGAAVLTAYDRAAANGTPVPDMSGGIAAILTALACLIPALAQIFPIFQNYHRERMDQQARGIPPSGVPFPPPPPPPVIQGPSPTGGMVNNEAIQ